MKQAARLVLFAVLLAAFATSSLAADLAIEYPKDKIHFAHTQDGWDLSIVRFHPSEYGKEVREGTLPVILVHGITSTSIIFHMGGDSGLAPYLAKRGYDVWAANLRGRREGSIPSCGNDLEWGWTFYDYLEKDLPAIIETVRKETGAKKVNWVGHSMGGILMYVYAENNGGAPFQAAVTVGSPMTFDYDDAGGRAFFRTMQDFSHRKRLFVGWWARLLAKTPQKGRLVEKVWSYVCNPDNFEPMTRKLYLYNSLQDLSAKVLYQFTQVAASGRLIDPRDGTDYTAGLDKVDLPLLLISGTADYLAPPESVKAAFDRLGSEDKTWVNFGVEEGQPVDFGHLDLLMGTYTAPATYPLILQWLDARQPVPNQCEGPACRLLPPGDEP